MIPRVVDAPTQLTEGVAKAEVGATDEQIEPEVTPPGATQLEVDPESVKFVREPVFPELEASVSVVTDELVPEAVP